jgi:hypothetical protein
VATAGETERKLAAQVKLSLTIGEKDEECKKTFLALWADYNNSELFDQKKDRLALFVQLGTNTLLGDFGRLLDIAHSSADPKDFSARLLGASKKAKEQENAIRAIVAKGAAVVSDDGFLGFLKILSLGSYDLLTKTATTEHQVTSLLAITANTMDPIETAEATWAALVELVSLAKPQGRCFVRNDLPASLLANHGRVSTEDDLALKNLRAHSDITVRRISDSIGGRITLKRDALVSQATEFLADNKAILITGAAGSGKSGLAREILAQAKDAVLLAFRAEELGRPHLDLTLQEAHANIPASRLGSLLAAEGQKLILVESLERLLEADVRDAFADLLTLVRSDPAMRLIMTCRDYSADTAQSSLIAPGGLTAREVKVAGFADDELDQVASAIPEIAPLLQEKGLKELLRLPYMLNMAARMSWSSNVPVPTEEFAFRSRCWKDIVSKESFSAGAMPKRRADAFVGLALRRARELRPFVPVEGFDGEAVDALRKDGLVALSDESPSLAAPSHDVLEDWALMRWLDDTYALGEYDPKALVAALSPHPAIRRSVRKWLGDLLRRHPERADRFVAHAVTSPDVPAYLRDDALAATLLSDSAASFLERNSPGLLGNDAEVLIRAIHLLRVVAKSPSPWLPRSISDGFLVASGPTWPAMVKFVNQHLRTILPRQIPLLVGLIEDWAARVSVWEPEPDGFKEAGSIAFQIVDVMDGVWGGDNLSRRLLSVIVRIPTAWQERTVGLINRACEDQPDPVARQFVRLVLPGSEGALLARALPDDMIRLTKTRLLLPDGYRQTSYGSPTDLEPFFGMKGEYSHDFYPASALRGPFMALLNHHPRAGTRLIIDLANHAARWYAEGLYGENLEPAFPVVFTLPDGSDLKQWANGRLWALYRGMSVGPYALKSALMALEHWLLELCKNEKVDVDAWMLWLFAETNSVAITAVLASVSMAYPQRAPRTGVAVLGAHEAIWMDRQRMVSEGVGAGFAAGFTEALGRIPGHLIYESERKTADSLKHRKSDLEVLALTLQQTGAREEVWRLIDRYRASLPPEAEQTEEDLKWRLALHRIDLRGFREVAPPPNAPTQAEDGQRLAYFGPSVIEPDIQGMVDQARADYQPLERDLGILNWAMSVWEGKAGSDGQASEWRGMLAKARERYSALDPVEEYARGGPELVAAICVRDHLDELDSTERAFCLGVLVNEIKKRADTTDRDEFYGGLSRSDRASAIAICQALAVSDRAAPDKDAIHGFATAITHAVPEVRRFAAAGALRYFTGAWRDYLVRCAAALAIEAGQLEGAKADDDWYDERLETSVRVRAQMRELVEAGGADAAALETLDFSTWSGRSAALYILTMLSGSPDLADARSVYAALAAHFARLWKRKPHNEREERHYEFEYAAATALAVFVLRLPAQNAIAICTPLLTLVEEDSEDLGRFIRDLIAAEDASDSPTPFWELWRLFSEPLKTSWRVKGAAKDQRYSSQILRSIFLGVGWKRGVTSWRRMDGHERDVEALAKDLTPSAAVLSAFCNFLDTVGSSALPMALVTVADILSNGDARLMLSAGDSGVVLEALLRPFVYREPFRVKSDPPVRTAILRIIDDLVDNGSSVAFRMRDDFVTPGRPDAKPA